MGGERNGVERALIDSFLRFSPLNFLDFGCAPFEFFACPFIRFVLYHDIIRATGLKRSVALVLLRPIVAFLGGFVGVHPEDGVVVLGSKGLAGGFWQAEQAGGQSVRQTAGVSVGQYGHAADIAGGPAGGQIDQMRVLHAAVLKIALVVAADDQAVAVGQLHSLDVRRVVAPWVFNARRPQLAAGL